MIISRTPFRVSLFGGGSDYPQWYRQHGGSVLGIGINKYCYISCRSLPPFFEHKHRIVYSNIELINNIQDIQHPAVRACLSELPPEKGIEIHHDGDLPARSGLGSSSSFTVGLLNVLLANQGKTIPKMELAQEAIRIEQEVIKEHVGSQDQVWAAFGGLNRIDFHTDDTMDIRPVIIDRARRQDLLDHCLLYFTGISRYASEIAKTKIDNLAKKEQQIQTMTAMVDEGLDILQDTNRPITEVGKLLNDSWQLKRNLTDKVTTPEVDEIYAAAMNAGASGGKLLGAGGGGFMLFIVEPERRNLVKEALKNLIQVKFDFDMVGSKIVVYEPNGLQNQ